MLNFQPKTPPRNWTSRREQRRLLMLVALAGGVMLLFAVASKPQMYAWFTNIGKQPQAPEDAQVDTRPKRSTRTRDLRAGLFAVTADAPADAPAAAPPGDRFPGVQMEYFRAIKDNTLHRPAEAEAWFHLLDIASKTPQETLEAASRGRVTFLQLFRQPEIYRAELVTITGTVHRIVPQEIPPNYVDLSGEYYQVWLQPENSAHPVVVYALSLPEGLAIADEMNEPAEVTGFFFKVWAYAAKEEPRTAPILLAKTLRWKEERVRRTFDRPATVPTERPQPPAVAKSPRAYAAENWDFGDDAWSKFVDGQTMPAVTTARDDEAATLLKLLNNLPRLPRDAVEAWTQSEAALPAIVADPAKHRGEIFRVEGRATKCEQVAVPEELARLFDFDAVYRTEIRPHDGGPLRVVYSPAVPRGWLRDEKGNLKTSATLDEQTAAVAMFVKRGADVANQSESGATAGTPELVFVARRLSWWSVSLLAQLGVDMALFDDVVQGSEIAGEEAACLYTMLASAPKIESDGLEKIAREYQFKLQQDFPYEYRDPSEPSNSFVLNEVRSRPERSAGLPVTLSATALRAVRVQVPADAAAKYGFDHYYHVDASVPLDPPITIVQRKKAADKAATGGAAAGGEDKATGEAPDRGERTETLRNDMNVVFCVRQLPDGFPEGEKINESIRVPAFFFKTWAAASPKSAEVNPRARNQYPMFIADSMIWYGESEPPWWIGGTIVGVLVGLLALAAVVALVNRRGNRDLDKALARQRTETDGSLDAVEVPANGPPDFSFLAEAEKATASGSSGATAQDADQDATSGGDERA